jgi:CYTH domain-containing protein
MQVATEIERKFLLERLPTSLAGVEPVHIMQGYLAMTEGGTQVRVRLAGDEAFLTVKSGAGMVRSETEIPLAPEQFRVLWEVARHTSLEKDRYAIDQEGLVLEIDVFGGALGGLLVAEVEFPTEAAAEAFSPPAWFGVEITSDLRYTNVQLALAGRVPDLG